jgi:hypothetical protein
MTGNPTEPITREEYERRLEELRQKYETFARRSNRILAGIVIAVLIVAGSSAYLLRENGKRIEESAKFSVDLSASIVESCRTSSNPLRRGLREEKEDELHSREHPDPEILKALHLSRAQAIELAQPEIKKLKQDINVRYAVAHCAALYPYP